MATYVCKISDGTLVSYNPNDSDPVAPPAVLTAKGLEAHSGLLPLDTTHIWDPASKSVLVVTPQSQSNQIDTMSFWLLFTAAELAAIRASANTAIQRFVFAIGGSHTLDLNSAPMQNFVNGCATAGLITAGRAAAILQSGS